MGLSSQNKRTPLVALTNISLHYGQVQALKNIHLTLDHSEVHAIVGEHGAGKSSLGLMLNGMLQPANGTITFEGRVYPAFTVTNALKLGIRMIYQQVRLYNEFTVAENLFLTNNTINRFTWKPRKRFLKAARDLLAQYDFDIDPSASIKSLNLSDQTLVEILKHIYHHPRLLILDEVLERLSSPTLHKIIGILMQLKQAGMSILFITHRIDDIYNLADRVSILKNGEVLLSDEVRNIDKINLIKMAYTQISAENNIENLNQEFYQLLKYNEAILRNLPVNLIVTDNEHKIKMVNEYCKHSFGLKATSYFSLPLEQLFPPDNAEVLTVIKSAFSSNDEHVFYHVPLTLNNTTIISNIKIFPIYDGTFLIGYILIIEDITEYDRLQKQVILSEKLASVGLLAAGVAHEINNPLEIIYNYLSYIKYNLRDKMLCEAVDNVHEEISTIANIVSNLHSFSDNRQFSNEDININDVIQKMLSLIKHHARHKDITIHFDPCSIDLPIEANTNEIKQVLLNLFKNSFEAMPSGGEIFINTTRVQENGKDVVQVTFTDTGPGICDDNPNNIFLPFYSTKKDQEQNLGLGLSVSYAIIKKYHGTIAVQNIEHSGCRFIIKLPQSR